MIFNSISKEMRQGYAPVTSSPANSLQYFPPRHYLDGNHREGSSIAQMNQKIAENIEIMRYRDRQRVNDLRSSKISHSSNRSNKSGRSSHSIRRAQQPIKLPMSNTYGSISSSYPVKVYKVGGSSWETRERSEIYSIKDSGQYRTFTREPVTLGSSKINIPPQREWEDRQMRGHNKYRQQNEEQFMEFGQRGSILRQDSSNLSKSTPLDFSPQNSQNRISKKVSRQESDFFDFREEPQFQTKMPGFKYSVLPPTSQNKANQGRKEKIVNHQDDIQVKSSLNSSPPLNSSPDYKNGVNFIAIGIVALGLLLLLLQSIK